ASRDSFGRLLETRFPGADKEVVSYAYDQGGNLQSVYGQKLGFTPAQLNEPPHSTYLTHRGYDEFGKVTREISGNLSTSRSKRGTEVAALFYSLIESAKLAELAPKAYLKVAIDAALRKAK